MNINKKLLSILILISGIFVVGAMASPVDALEVSYPVVELGNCANQTSCKTYCDQSANVDACLSFAEKNNLMSKDEISVAKNFKKAGMTGPGGCKGKEECSTYCNGPEHMDACVAFAEKSGIMSGSRLEEAKKVQGAISRGIKPPACGGKDACNSYCSSKDHMAECVSFAEAAGIISKEDADKIRSGGPGGQGGDDRQGPGGQGPGDQNGGQGQQGGPGGQQGGPDGQQGPKGQGPGGLGQGGQQGGGQGQGRGGGGNGGGGRQGGGGQQGGGQQGGQGNGGSGGGGNGGGGGGR